ncbi:SDR family oxidoreductase [Arthrobacter sp. BE255]|uniref:SDR family oxidoreductase n=1 Tax=Arthrobacter sp. BE255 TaxID=2817721 RepID=UPI0037C16D5E
MPRAEADRLLRWPSGPAKQFDSAIAVNRPRWCSNRERVLDRRRAGRRRTEGYVASKFGVGFLTRAAALDYAASGISVNAITPGPILTDRLAEAGGAAQAGAAAAVPLGRIGHAEEVAEAALWLCSDEQSRSARNARLRQRPGRRWPCPWPQPPRGICRGTARRGGSARTSPG